MKIMTVFVACASMIITSVAAQIPAASSPVIVQMSYYAQPGREDDVLRLRLRAAELLVKRGLDRGRVWRAIDSPRAAGEPGPTVVWQAEFADEAALRKYEEVADKDPDFLAIRKEMGTITVSTRTDRRYYREAR
jgi:hypothetical protein